MKTRGTDSDTSLPHTEDTLRANGWGMTPPRPDQLSREHLWSLRLFGFLVITIFLAEVVAMGLIYILPPLPYHYTTLIDAGVMTVLIFPILYLLSFRPLIDHIQRRYWVELALRKQKDLEERFFNSIDLLIAYMDCDFNVIHVNDAFARENGQSPDFYVGKNHFVMYPQPRKKELFQRVLVTGEPCAAYEDPVEYLQGHRGETRYWDWSLQPVKGTNGIVEGLVLSLLDVTPRKRAADSVRQLSRIVEQTEDTVVVTDPSGIIEYMNPAFERMTGFTRQEILGKTPRLLKSGLHDRDFYRTLWETVLRGDVFQSEIANRKKNGELFYEVKTVTPLRNASGDITHFVATGKDITKHKQAEEQLRKAYEELERRVEERTEALRIANADLEGEIQERRYAEEALRQAHAELEKRVQERTQELVREITERKEIERQLRLRTTAMEAAANGILITDYQGKIQWANPALTRISGYDPVELMGLNPRVFNGGRHDTSYYRQMWETIHAGQVWRGETINRRKDGTLYVEEQTITPVPADHGQITHFIAIKEDITERKLAEEKLAQRNAELQIISTSEHNQRQFSESLIAAALILNKSLKLNEVLSLILEQIRGAIPYQLADILFLDGDSFYDASHLGDVEWPAVLENNTDRFHLASFPLLERIYRSGVPALVAETREEPGWTMIEGFAWVRSALSAPLLVDGRIIGFVNLFSDQPEYFTQQMSDRLVAFAAQAAVAIQNAWLFEQVQASTERLQSLSRRLVEIQETERLHISRELHDEAGQVLTSLLVDLQLLEKNSSQPEAILKIVAEMERSLNDVIENLHRMAMALRPASLDHVGLVAALRQYVETLGEKHHIQARFRSSGAIERLPANVETILYRTVQEALTNVVRHAQATRVDVVLMLRDEKLVVLVEDDGVGFDPLSVSTDDHLGLFGIRERAEMIGAALVIESEPGKGTTIMMEVGYADTTPGRR